MEQELLLLQQQRDLVEMLNDASIDQVLAINTDFEIIAWNKTCETETGLLKADVMGKPVTEVFPLLRKDENMLHCFKQALLGYKCFVPAEEQRYRAGYYEHHLVPLRKETRLIGVMIIIHDVAHRIKAESDLKEINKTFALFKRITDTCYDVVTCLDLSGKVIYWNPAAEKLYKFAADEVMGRSVKDFIIPAHKMEEYKELGVLSKRGESIVNRVTQRVDRDGQVIDILLNVFPVRDEHGRITGTCGISKDITEQLKYISSIQSLNEELVQKNHQLHNLNSELKAFTQLAVLNYNEPLRNLYLHLEQIVNDSAASLSSSGRANLRRSQAAVQKMKLLTEDVIGFASLGESELEKTALDMNEVCAGVLKDFESRLTHLSIDVKVDALPVINGYRSHAELLIRNLLDNAIKFRLKDAATKVHIRYERMVKEPVFPSKHLGKMEYDVIIVEDNGIGFGENDYDTIFQLFTRLQPDQYRGSGIGLAICKKIMEMHGGFIRATAVAGEGASFSCFFPAA